MRQFKSFLSLLLVTVMLTGMLPAGATENADLPKTQGASVTGTAEQNSEDGFTVVSTAEELRAAANNGSRQIRLSNDIVLNGFYVRLMGNISLDLNGFTLSAATSENAGCVISMLGNLIISNGTVKGSDDGGLAIWIQVGALTLSSVTVIGGILNDGSESRLMVGSDSDVDLVYGGTFVGDSSKDIPAIRCYGNIDMLSDCTVTYDHPDGGGTGAMIVGNTDRSVSGTIGAIVNCTFAGSGSRVSGISLFSGSIGYISFSTITGSGDRHGLINRDTIGYLYVPEGYYIDSIEGGKIGSSETNAAIWNYGEIGSIEQVWLEGLYDSVNNYGKIGRLLYCTLKASADYSRAIQVIEGKIDQITKNTTYLPDNGSFIVVQVDGAVGEVTGNTADAPINNSGMNGGGTVDMIENNVITTTQSWAIQNSGTLITLGENTLRYSADGVGVSNRGIINTVTIPLSKLSDMRYEAASGWTLENCGTILNLTLNLSTPELTVGLNSNNKPVLTWDAVDGAEKYEVWRAVGNGEYSRLWTGTGRKLTNTSAEEGKTYSYKVRAVAGTTYSEYSAVKTITVPAEVVLEAPTLTAANKASTGKVVLSWSKIDGAEKYEIWFSTSKSGMYKKLWTGTGTTVNHNSATEGVTYYYKVRAMADGVYSEFSALKLRACDLAQPVVTVSNNASTGKVVISWKAVSGAAKYEVYRSTSKNGTYTRLWTGTGTKLNHTSSEVGVTYYYKVRALHATNTSATSAYSEIKSRTCDCARPVLTVTLNSKGKPVLTWGKVEGAVKYEVYRSTSENGTYSLLWSGTGTKLTNSSAKAGTTYYYKVKAICSVSSGNSAYSVVESVTAK